MKNLYLLENIDYSNLKKKINTQDSEIITFDYFSHNILSAHQIKHRKMDEYLEEQDREKFFKNLNNIGYCFSDEKKYFFNNIVRAFQRRYRKELINGLLDKECLIIAQNLSKKL